VPVFPPKVEAKKIKPKQTKTKQNKKLARQLALETVMVILRQIYAAVKRKRALKK